MTDTELDAFEEGRDFHADLLYSIREMKAGNGTVVYSPNYCRVYGFGFIIKSPLRLTHCSGMEFGETMPQLPSGLHFALDPSPLQEIVNNAYEEAIKVHNLMAIESVDHLFSHINILYFKETSENVEFPLSEHSALPPKKLEPYPSGFNLITIKSEFEVVAHFRMLIV